MVSISKILDVMIIVSSSISCSGEKLCCYFQNKTNLILKEHICYLAQIICYWAQSEDQV